MENLREEASACGVCGEIYKESFENKICVLARCDGIVRQYNRLLLPVVSNLSKKGLYVNEATIFEQYNKIEISLTFRDDYGNHFKPLPENWVFFPIPDPEKHSSKFPIKLTKVISKNLSNVGQLEDLLESIFELLAWAKKHSHYYWD